MLVLQVWLDVEQSMLRCCNMQYVLENDIAFRPYKFWEKHTPTFTSGIAEKRKRQISSMIYIFILWGNAMLRGNSDGQRKCVTTGLRATQLHGQLESMDWSRKMGAVKSLFIKKIFSTVHLQALPISMVVSRLPVFYKQKGLSTLLGIFLTYVIGFEHMFEDIIKKNGGYGALDITNESYDDMDRRLKHKKRRF
ncbi:hypothetical protein HKD37_10G027352 [Glycine soja]